jgi:hypothetical protein
MKCLIDRFTFDIRLTIYSDFVSVNNYFLLTYSARDKRIDEYCYSTFHFIELNEDISQIIYCCRSHHGKMRMSLILRRRQSLHTLIRYSNT